MNRGFLSCLAIPQEGVLTVRVGHDHLVESHASAAGFRDASTGSLGELESGDLHLRDFEQALVVSDGADNDSGVLGERLLDVVLNKLGQRHRRLVGPGGHKSTQNDAPYTRVRPPCQKPEQLRCQWPLGHLP